MNRTMRFSVLLLTLLLPLTATAETNLEFGTFSADVVRGGIDFTPNLLELEGETIRMVGYMAPPLKPRVEWFVLTREPLATCPYCSDAAEWPADVVFVRLPSGRTANTEAHNTLIEVIGRLELGIDQTEEEGLSLIRLIDVRVQRVR